MIADAAGTTTSSTVEAFSNAQARMLDEGIRRGSPGQEDGPQQFITMFVASRESLKASTVAALHHRPSLPTTAQVHGPKEYMVKSSEIVIADNGKLMFVQMAT